MAVNMAKLQQENSVTTELWHKPIKHRDPISFDIDYNSIRSLKYLSSGSMCQVYSGLLGERRVVIKFPRQDKFELASRDLDTELQLMQLLDHPNICKLYGAGVTPEGSTFICVEALTGDTLSSFLGTEGSSEGGIEVFGRWLTRMFYMPLVDAIKHAISVASALHYMHSEAIPGAVIMHRDFKSSNMGFDSDGTLKLFDFGLSKILTERERSQECERYTLTGNTGSLRYMAPEVALDLPYDEKADVYSFGILLWELASLKRPYDLYTVYDFRKKVALEGERPQLDDNWPIGLRHLLSKCWAHNIEDRPSMGVVKQELEEILSMLQK